MDNGWKHSGTYQGYPIHGVEYRRSSGLAPDRGFVLLSLADVKAIHLHARTVPWRGVNGYELSGQADLRALLQLGATVTTPPDMPQPEEGLDIFGSLVLRSYRHGQLVDEHIYKDVQVDESGMEDLSDDYDEALSHDRGLLRVPITDIRRYYADHSAFFGRYNVQYPDGTYDPTTINAETSQPWSFHNIVFGLFASLPGSPVATNAADFADLPAPTNIVGEGEPVSEHLDALLKKVGLEPEFQPDNNYRLWRRGAAEVILPSQIPIGNGASIFGEYKIAEKKSQTMTARPPAVMVVGKKIIRRMQFYCVPVLRDEDGNYGLLAEVIEDWGYPLQRVQDQLFMADQKRFQDVEPLGAFDGRRHAYRRELLKEAYKLYAPAIFFPKGADGKAPRLSLAHLQRQPYLPFTNFSMLDAEFKTLDRHWAYDPNAQKQIGEPIDVPTGRGDLGPWFLARPFARGFSVGQTLYHSWDALAAEYARRMDDVNAVFANFQSLIDNKLHQIQNAAEPLKRAQFYAGPTDGVSELEQKFKAMTGSAPETTDVTKYSADAAEAFVIAGVSLDVLLKDKIDASCLAAIKEVENLGQELDRLKQAHEAMKTKLSQKWPEELGILEAVYKKHKAFKVWGNIGHGILKGVSIDDRTGILRAPEPLVVCTKPYYFEPDMAIVLTDGAVCITAGYESHYGSIRDWTTITLAPALGDLENADPDVKIIGVNSPVPVKCKTVKMKSRMYLGEMGTPYNYTECKAEAVGTAKEMFHMKPIVDGFRADYMGFRNAVLDLGCESVQHVFDGDEASTTIVVESPRLRAPLGPAAMKGHPDNAAVESRQQLERER